MSKQPDVRYWKRLERHQLSAEYPDLSGAAAENMLDGIKRFGVLNKRPVTLHEGKVLDGWQMYTACVEANVKPTFQSVPKGMTPEEFVQVVNDHRRHESPELALARIGTRRKRAAELRSEGKSTHVIAEELGVSQPTVLRDLSSVDTPVSTGKVKGKDGRSYSATKPEREPGDDTAVIEAERAAPKNGRVLYERQDWDTAFGRMVREIDKLGKAYRAVDTPQAEGLRRLLAEYKAQFWQWHKALVKAHREK